MVGMQISHSLIPKNIDIAQQIKTASSSGNGVDIVLDFAGLTRTFNIARMSLRSVRIYRGVSGNGNTMVARDGFRYQTGEN